MFRPSISDCNELMRGASLRSKVLMMLVIMVIIGCDLLTDRSMSVFLIAECIWLLITTFWIGYDLTKRLMNYVVLIRK